ncbi:hypothetical protein PGTUg99_018960 [Puccinia graminis f. sp. tritici]|uniref:Uncharacterized protein n=1 Tax=Puccinia graminis f. sp. tritici TaxID=56615 RepID=A0A5B0QGR9_PUCGR|nr:hypothetical protein PGTUg99_018960 [Puccinia graminis f. sp. tritici]
MLRLVETKTRPASTRHESFHGPGPLVNPAALVSSDSEFPFQGEWVTNTRHLIRKAESCQDFAKCTDYQASEVQNGLLFSALKSPPEWRHPAFYDNVIIINKLEWVLAAIAYTQHTNIGYLS